MVGNKYGHLTVKQMLPKYKGNKTFCLCDCDCGKQGIIKNAWGLRNKCTKLTSCGCTSKEKARKYSGVDVDGKRFGRLLVLETLWEENPPKVKCKCDCGTIKVFNKNDVQSGHTQSCGCMSKEITSQNSTKDWSGYISESGVRLIKPLYQNHKHVWIWECLCPLCGKSFAALPIKVYTNHTTSCGCKKKSSGERIVENYLIKNDISFIRQYSFSDCKYKQKLLFDFAILFNNQVRGLVEYDGIQHFKPVKIFGGDKALHGTIVRDKIKDDYCKTHNLPLLRINYNQSCDEIKQNISEYIESLTTTGDIWQQIS